MDSKHLIILKFLLEQKEPVHIDDFPNYITSMYNPGISKGSFLFELMVTLKNKEWVKEVNFQDYTISDYGKEALIRENPPLPKYERNMLDFGIELKRRELETYGNIKTQPLDLRSLPISQNANITPAEKEKQQNAIVKFIVKYWWGFVVPLIIGIALLAIEKKWFK